MKRVHLSGKAALIAALLPFSATGAFGQGVGQVGEGPNHRHIEQSQIDDGELSLAQIIAHGRQKFTVDFNVLDGLGDPARLGINAVGEVAGFNRISGPDSVACTACHGKPFAGGAGDNTAAIFPAFNRPDNVDAPSFEGLNVKNSQSVFGGGAKQRLAEEMTAEIQATADEAAAQAADSGQPVTLPLSAKGVSFGQITAMTDGTLDTAAIEGISPDLQIRPFNSIGTTLSLRDFTVDAMEQHFGIEAEERFEADGDGDGVERELTVGDVTATALFQAALPIPTTVVPDTPAELAAALRGRTAFSHAQCEGCHIPSMIIDDPVFRERAPDSEVAAELDLTRDGFAPTLRGLDDGTAIIRLFSDLKRHDMGAQLAEPLLQNERASTQHFMTLPLWGVNSTGPWMHDGRASTLTEAIMLHGGEGEPARQAYQELPESAQADLIEFLKTLQIVLLDERLRDHQIAPAQVVDAL